MSTMSSVASAGLASQAGARAEAPKTRRQRGIASAIESMNRTMRRREKQRLSFIRTSDLQAIWTTSLLKDIISDGLTGEQVSHVRTHLLPLVSFLVWIGVKHWFDKFVPTIFASGAAKIITLPKTLEELEELGVPIGPNTHMDDQYLFIPATIILNHEEEIHRIPDKNIRLPFESSDPNPLHGGYGTVEFSTLAQGHVKLMANGEPIGLESSYVVAVKSFQVRRDAADEVRNLQLLKSSLATTWNASLSLHLALIEHGSRFLILFDQAKFGDLWQFLYAGNPPDSAGREKRQYRFEARFPRACQEEAELSAALLEQAVNLSFALEFLHTPRRLEGTNTFCAHMDLKPDNILIFHGKGPVGSWKICDFGISAFKENEEDEAAPSGSVGDLYSLATMRVLPKRSEGTYQAPEVYNIQQLGDRSSERDRRRVGRKGDIWSFGAILAELLSFTLKRDKYVKAFREERVRDCREDPKNDYYFDLVFSPSLAKGLLAPKAPTVEFRLRPAVQMWLRSIARDASSPRRYFECWAEVILRILNVDMAERPDAKELVVMMAHVFKHMQWARQSKKIPCFYLGDVDEPQVSHMRRTSNAQDIRGILGQGSPSSPPPRASLAPTWPEHTENQAASASGFAPRSDGIRQNPIAPTQDGSPGLGISAAHAQGGLGFEDIFTSADTRWDNPDQLSAYHDDPEVDPLSQQANLPEVHLPTIIHTQPSQHQLRQTHVRVRTNSSPCLTPPLGEAGSPGPRIDSLSSLILRRPANAFGIKVNPSKERAPSSRRSGKLPSEIKSTRAVSIDAGVPGRIRVAYLLKSSFSVYEVHPPILKMELLSSQDLTCPRKGKWEGIAVSGNIVSVWGNQDQSAALHVARFSSDGATQIRLPTDDLFRHHDYTKRVAVSRLGVIALICGDKIAVVNLNHEPPAVVCRQTQRDCPQRYDDIAFDDSGELLYAWAKGSAKERAGALFVYRITELDRTQPESKGFYKYDTNDQRPTRILPYNDYQGCIIAANQQLFYPAVVRAFDRDDRSNLPRFISERLKEVDVKAACMFNNHSLITVQKNKFGSGKLERHYRLMEHPLDFTGLVHRLGEPHEICKLNMSSNDTAAEVRAWQYEDDIFVIVFTTNGQIEWLRFDGTSSRDTNVKGKGKAVDIVYR